MFLRMCKLRSARTIAILVLTLLYTVPTVWEFNLLNNQDSCSTNEASRKARRRLVCTESGIEKCDVTIIGKNADHLPN